MLFRSRVIPSVDWTTVTSVIIDLEYDDKDGDLHQQTTFSFTKDAKVAFQDWRFPLRQASDRTFSYRQTLLYTNAGHETSDWVTVSANPGTLVVGNAPGGVVQLEIDPADTEIGTTVRRVIARLRYSDPAHQLVRSAVLVFPDTTPQTWAIARADAAVTGYTYDLEYIMNDGSHRQLTGSQGQLPAGGLSDYLAMPPPPPPAPGPVQPPLA